jgi:phosphoribosylformylglycinamidine synthase
MSGTYENINVPPTLISFAVVTQDANKVISPEFKKINSTIALVLPKYLEDQTLDFDSLKTNYDIVHHAIVNTNIISAYSLKHYGVAEGLSKMSVGNNVGVNFQNVTEQELFGINYGGMLVEIPDGINVALLLKGSNYKIIGKTTSDPIITCKALNVNISISDIKKQISNKLSDIFSHTTKSDAQNVYLKPYFNNKPIQSKKRVALPLVVIPVFPGTNCEYDSKYAFERAGAKVELVLIRNLNNKTLLESIETLAKAIKRANIIMLPGGFSAADEPDGSAKFIVNVFNNQKIKNAVEELITKRDGLMIGICNGFQALIKLGLVPYGHIQPITSNAPTLTFNKIHHHISAIVRTKVVSNKSPWLAALKPNDVRLVAISHGEGQFVASPQQIKEMEVNGQIATQYVNLQNAPTMNMPYNPNGSTSAIEGITSVDGRIFGKMGHSERIGKNLYRNVLGEYDQKIFESGVKYFTHKD